MVETLLCRRNGLLQPGMYSTNCSAPTATKYFKSSGLINWHQNDLVVRQRCRIILPPCPAQPNRNQERTYPTALQRNPERDLLRHGHCWGSLRRPTRSASSPANGHIPVRRMVDRYYHADGAVWGEGER